MRTITVVLLTLGWAVLTAAPAGAELRTTGDESAQAPAARPSSVVVVAPETGASAVLRWTEVDYAQLSSLVKPGRGASMSTMPPKESREGRSVIVSWLVDNTEVWRVDRIYYEAPGGPWIATEVRMATVDPGSRTAWHTSRDGDRLLEVLRDMRVIDVEYVGGDAGSGADTAPAAEPTAVSRPAEPDRWAWAGGGLLVGVVLALALVWWGGTPRGRDRAPRQQLIDL